MKIRTLDPLRAKKIFMRKAEDVPYLGFGYKSLISDPISLTVVLIQKMFQYSGL